MIPPPARACWCKLRGRWVHGVGMMSHKALFDGLATAATRTDLARRRDAQVVG